MKSKRPLPRQRRAQQLLAGMSLLVSFLPLNACRQNSNDTQSSLSALATEATDKSRDTPSAPIVHTAFPNSDLQKGEKIWTDNCFSCHGTGRAGAPKIGEKSQWSPRIAQGVEVLIGHALSGFYGKGGTEMPARGGNSALSDEDVKAAVAYMVTQSR